jgi:hypothetical protein
VDTALLANRAHRPSRASARRRGGRTDFVRKCAGSARLSLARSSLCRRIFRGPLLLAHNLYYRGLFDFGRTIRASDVFLTGSSHMQLGISARRIAEATGNKVFNLAVGCDGSPAFGLEIIRQNKAKGRLIVADLFGLKAGDECRREAKENDLFQAYATVIQAWTEFAFDWLADPVLPRLVVRNGRLERQRYLVGLVVINDWLFGDAVQVWRPDAGVVYGAGVGGLCSPGLEAVGIPELGETTSAYSIATPQQLTRKGLPRRHRVGHDARSLCDAAGKSRGLGAEFRPRTRRRDKRQTAALPADRRRGAM